MGAQFPITIVILEKLKNNKNNMRTTYDIQ